MIRRFRHLLIVWCCLLLDVRADTTETLDLSGCIHQSGYFDLYWDEAQGKLWLELEHMGSPFLYVSSLASGLGSNPVGLDRGQLGSRQWCHRK